MYFKCQVVEKKYLYTVSHRNKNISERMFEIFFESARKISGSRFLKLNFKLTLDTTLNDMQPKV